MTIMAQEAISESLDPRDPLLRLSTFFDDQSIELLHERDRSGVLAAAGTVNGVRTIAFCTDARIIASNTNPTACKAFTPSASRAPPECQIPTIALCSSIARS